MESLLASLVCIDDMFQIGEAQNGNPRAFEELVGHHDLAVLRFALHLTRSESDAQDIYQKALLRAHRKLGSLRVDSCFSTWIYRVVINLCMDRLRKKQRRREDFVAATAEGENFDLLDTIAADRSAERDAAITRQELGFRMDCALQRLTPQERVIFELKHYHGMKLRSIRAITRASEQAVKTSFFRATRKMRAGLADLR
jgi:RNA polymerase sigma-70 factor (ECF subfamily)